MSRGEYTFITTDLLTHSVIGEVELTAINWEDMRNRPGGGSATARIDSPSSNTDYLRSWASALWAIRDGEIQFGGIIGNVQPKGGTRVIQIPLLGFMEFFRHRFVRDLTGMRYATRVGGTVRWRQVDQFRIIEDLVRHAQAFPRTALGIELHYDTLSGVLRDQAYHLTEAKSIGDAFEQLAEQDNGFDWWQTYYLQDGVPQVRFHLANDRSYDAPYMLRFETERKVYDEITIQSRLQLPGIIGSYAASPQIGLSDPTSFLMLRIVAQPDMGWQPPQKFTLVSHWDEESQEEVYRLEVLPTGQLFLTWTDLEGNRQWAASRYPLPETGSVEMGVAVELAVEDIPGVEPTGEGAWEEEWRAGWRAADINPVVAGVTFLYSLDGENWVEFDAVTNMEMASLPNDNKGVVEIGSHAKGNLGLWSGSVRWFTGFINNRAVPRYWMDARPQSVGARSWMDARGNIWQLHGSRCAIVPAETIPSEKTIAVSSRSNVEDYDADGGPIPVSDILVVGAGHGDDMQWVRVTTSDDPPIPAYEMSYVQKDVRGEATLLSQGKALLEQRERIRQQLTMTIDPNARPHYSEIAPAQNVRVFIRDGYMQLLGTFNIYRKSLNFTKNQDVRATIELLELESEPLPGPDRPTEPEVPEPEPEPVVHEIQPDSTTHAQSVTEPTVESVAPDTTPDPPTGLVVTAGDASASHAFTPPPDAPEGTVYVVETVAYPPPPTNLAVEAGDASATHTFTAPVDAPDGTVYVVETEEIQ